MTRLQIGEVAHRCGVNLQTIRDYERRGLLPALPILAVEMQPGGLYALARAKNRNVICLAHVTNQMGQIGGVTSRRARSMVPRTRWPS